MTDPSTTPAQDPAQPVYVPVAGDGGSMDMGQCIVSAFQTADDPAKPDRDGRIRPNSKYAPLAKNGTIAGNQIQQDSHYGDFKSDTPDITPAQLQQECWRIGSALKDNGNFGSSGTTISLTHYSAATKTLTVANVGDSPINIYLRDPVSGKIVRRIEAYKDYSARDSEEQDRIQKAGGKVVILKTKGKDGTIYQEYRVMDSTVPEFATRNHLEVVDYDELKKLNAEKTSKGEEPDRTFEGSVMVSRAGGDCNNIGVTCDPNLAQYDLSEAFANGLEVIVTTETDGVHDFTNEQDRIAYIEQAGVEGNLAHRLVDLNDNRSLANGGLTNPNSDNATGIVWVLKPPGEVKYNLIAGIFDGHGPTGADASSLAKNIFKASIDNLKNNISLSPVAPPPGVVALTDNDLTTPISVMTVGVELQPLVYVPISQGEPVPVVLGTSSVRKPITNINVESSKDKSIQTYDLTSMTIEDAKIEAKRISDKISGYNGDVHNSDKIKKIKIGSVFEFIFKDGQNRNSKIQITGTKEEIDKFNEYLNAAPSVSLPPVVVIPPSDAITSSPPEPVAVALTDNNLTTPINVMTAGVDLSIPVPGALPDDLPPASPAINYKKTVAIGAGLGSAIAIIAGLFWQAASKPDKPAGPPTPNDPKISGAKTAGSSKKEVTKPVEEESPVNELTEKKIKEICDDPAQQDYCEVIKFLNDPQP